MSNKSNSYLFLNPKSFLSIIIRNLIHRIMVFHLKNKSGYIFNRKVRMPGTNERTLSLFLNVLVEFRNKVHFLGIQKLFVYIKNKI